MRVCLAKHDRPCVTQQAHAGAVGARHALAVDAHADGADDAGRVEEVLHRDRYAVKRPKALACPGARLRRCCLLESAALHEPH